MTRLSFSKVFKLCLVHILRIGLDCPFSEFRKMRLPFILSWLRTLSENKCPLNVNLSMTSILSTDHFSRLEGCCNQLQFLLRRCLKRWRAYLRGYWSVSPASTHDCAGQWGSKSKGKRNQLSLTKNWLTSKVIRRRRLLKFIQDESVKLFWDVESWFESRIRSFLYGFGFTLLTLILIKFHASLCVKLIWHKNFSPQW